MSSQPLHADVVIFGAGIAGLWLHARLRGLGYNSLLLETGGIGGVQSVGSQGILHSGLKYAFAGKINALAQSISAMGERWRACFSGDGELDLRATRISTDSQILMIPRGFMGGLVKLVAQKALGNAVREIPAGDWPEAIKESGFKGQLVYMDEPVLDIPSLIRALAEPHSSSIRRIDWDDVTLGEGSCTLGGQEIIADHMIFTAAGSNHKIATQLGHDHGLKTQIRPLHMGMLRPAPFELYAHLVGPSDKPVATITTHKDHNGMLVWYLGGLVAERAMDTPPQEVYQAARKGFAKYMPQLDLSAVQWNSLPVNRIEGKSDTEGWLPDTPVVHQHGSTLYCWPTKLTFAPMLADKVLPLLKPPSGGCSDWSFLAEAPYAPAPWDTDKTWDSA